MIHSTRDVRWESAHAGTDTFHTDFPMSDLCTLNVKVWWNNTWHQRAISDEIETKIVWRWALSTCVSNTQVKLSTYSACSLISLLVLCDPVTGGNSYWILPASTLHLFKLFPPVTVLLISVRNCSTCERRRSTDHETDRCVQRCCLPQCPVKESLSETSMNPWTHHHNPSHCSCAEATTSTRVNTLHLT